MQHSALDIATALEMPPPTDEQAAVIEAGARPLLVVAGAGSGKTETMAARVVWLVANGLVDPDQVLGLTFTRKAAAELSQRIAKRLRGLERAGIWTPPADDGTGAEVLGGTPTVSTYHAYAGRLVREHALRVGIEPEFRILTEAGAWQLAAEAVSRWDGPMDDVVKSEATVIQAVMALAGEMAEHVRTPGEVMEHLDAVLARLDALPDGEGRGSLTAARDAVAVLRERRTVLPIVEAFLALKRERESLDFADQMAIAARLTRSIPAVGEIERERFRAVLLDEFQDTSEAQLELLRSLFHHPGVALTAVGDPNQSIYGWRGASATTLLRFPSEFAGDAGPGRRAAALDELAQRLAHPRRGQRRRGAARDRARAAAPAAARRRCRARSRWPGSRPPRRRPTTSPAWIAAHWFSPSGRRTGRSAAVLCRRRSTFPRRARGAAPAPAARRGRRPRRTARDPGGERPRRRPLGRAGPDPRRPADAPAHRARRAARGRRPRRALGLGARAALATARARSGATAAARRRRCRRAGAGRTRRRCRRSSEPDGTAPATRRPTGRGSDLAADSADTATLVEALDDLPRAGWVGRDGARIGDEALARLHDLGDVVRRLRRLTALPLVDLVAEAEVAHRSRHRGALAPRAHGLDRPRAPRRLRRRRGALRHDRRPAHALGLPQLARRRPRPGARPRRRAHRVRRRRRAGADRPRRQGPRVGRRRRARPSSRASSRPTARTAVAPVADSDPRHTPAPATSRTRAGSSGSTRCPTTCAATAPDCRTSTGAGVPDRKALSAAIDAFVLDGRPPRRRRGAAPRLRRADPRPLRDAADDTPLGSREEDPVGAVALPDTRSRTPCPARSPARSGSRRPSRSSTTRARPRRRPTRTSRSRSRSCGRTTRWAPGAPACSTPTVASRRWSRPGPLCRKAIRGSTTCASSSPSRRRAVAGASPSSTCRVTCRPRRWCRWPRDAEAFAMSLRRPMPSPPAVAARQGTAFHAWIEEHYSRAAFVDLLDLPGSADEGAADDGDLDGMKERFLASEWADRIPEEIELSIETVIDGIAVRGRVDAVFPRDDGGWTVVDWKTGARPTGRDATVRALQLGAYAVAFARLRGVDPSLVDAAFYYAAEGVTVRPDLPGEAELVDLLRTLPE